MIYRVYLMKKILLKKMKMKFAWRNNFLVNEKINIILISMKYILRKR